MRTLPGCIPCLVQMAITTAKMGGAKDPELLEAARAAARGLSEADFRRPAPYFSEPILKRVYAIIQNPDPFLKAKSDSNKIGARLADELARPFVNAGNSDKDRVLRGIRAAIAGNVADYAVDPELGGSEEGKIRSAFKLEFSVNDFEAFYEKLLRSKNILFLCDNAGEVAFDRVLIEEFSRLGKKTVVAVKSGPALNDALMADALEVGLDKSPSVSLIATGQSRMGIDLESAGPEFQSAWAGSELVLAKGQANFESLAGVNGKIFFLTLVKCKALEAALGLKKGGAVFMAGKTFNEQFGFID